MSAPSRLGLAGAPVSRRRLRRLSRQFAAVGVEMSAARLAQIAAGAPAGEHEAFDIAFAETAIRLRRDDRRTKRLRAQRRCAHLLVVAGAIVVALGVLVCIGLGFFLLAAHPTPTF